MKKIFLFSFCCLLSSIAGAQIIKSRYSQGNNVNAPFTVTVHDPETSRIIKDAKNMNVIIVSGNDSITFSCRHSGEAIFEYRQEKLRDSVEITVSPPVGYCAASDSVTISSNQLTNKVFHLYPL